MILLLALHETDFNRCNGRLRCFVKGKFYNRTFSGKTVSFFFVARKSHKKETQVIWWAQDNCHLMKEKMGVRQGCSDDELTYSKFNLLQNSFLWQNSQIQR